MKNKKFKIILCVVLSAFSFQLSTLCYAQDDLKKIKQLETQVLSNLKDKKAGPSLEMLAEMYFIQRQYNSFIEFLRRVDKKKPSACEIPVGYYIALCRYHQLTHWEETQNWKEYFDLGNQYRQEVFLETQKLAEACPLSPFGLRAQALNWLLHKAQNDSLMEASLTKLMDMVNTYAKSAGDSEALKDIADTLARNEEKGFAQSLYKSYVNRLLENEQAPLKLQSVAQGALKEGNIELAEIIYERYIEIIRGSLAKDTLAVELIAIIKSFVTDGWNRGKDPSYAEKAFGVLQESCGKSYFTDELQYLRAYNLQRQKEYQRAIEEYSILVTDFPESGYVDEAEFKLGVLWTYVAGNKEKGLTYWQDIVKNNRSLEYVVESLYLISLQSQYAEDFKTAKAGYDKIAGLIAGKADFKNLSERIVVRQQEIQESKPIEYNLKMFLDTALKELSVNQAALELLVEPFKCLSFKQEQVKFSLMQLQMETGCLVPELTYLWSGDLGSVSVVPMAAEFSTEYYSAGTKVVALVVVSPSGIVGSTLEMVEVYNQR